MELCTNYELRGDMLIVTGRGTVRFDSVLRLLKEACDTAAEYRVNKILVDGLAVDGELAPFERYQLGTELASYLTERGMNVRLAFVGIPPAVNGFGVSIARNRGVAARVFSDHQEALHWIDDTTASDDAASAAP